MNKLSKVVLITNKPISVEDFEVALWSSSVAGQIFSQALLSITRKIPWDEGGNTQTLIWRQISSTYGRFFARWVLLLPFGTFLQHKYLLSSHSKFLQEIQRLVHYFWLMLLLLRLQEVPARGADSLRHWSHGFSIAIRKRGWRRWGSRTSKEMSISLSSRSHFLQWM